MTRTELSILNRLGLGDNKSIVKYSKLYSKRLYTLKQILAILIEDKVVAKSR